MLPLRARPENDGNEGILRIPQSSSITGTSPSDCLVLYPRHYLGGWVLLLCRGAVDVFYGPSWLGICMDDCVRIQGVSKKKSYLKRQKEKNETKQNKRLKKTNFSAAVMKTCLFKKSKFTGHSVLFPVFDIRSRNSFER